MAKKKMNGLEKYLARKAEYLAGKPIRMRWWVMLLYMTPWIFFAGVFWGPIIHDSVRAGIPLGAIFQQLELRVHLSLWVLACVFVLPPAMRMLSKMVIIEESGLYYRDSLRRKHIIPYTSITSYTIHTGYAEGISIQTSDKKHYFGVDMVGYTYLRDEIKLRVGEDKEEKKDIQKFWR